MSPIDDEQIIRLRHQSMEYLPRLLLSNPVLLKREGDDMMATFSPICDKYGCMCFNIMVGQSTTPDRRRCHCDYINFYCIFLMLTQSRYGRLDKNTWCPRLRESFLNFLCVRDLEETRDLSDSELLRAADKQIDDDRDGFFAKLDKSRSVILHVLHQQQLANVNK